MKVALLLLCAGTLALLGAGCATSQPAVSRTFLSQFTTRGVDADIVQRVRNGRVLSVDDIEACVGRGVPDSVLIPYLQSTRKIYVLTPDQQQNLRAAGASRNLLRYLDGTAGYYGNTGAGAGGQKHPYWNESDYSGAAPFAYDPPIISEMYNSSYEEALYSPFSFN